MTLNDVDEDVDGARISVRVLHYAVVREERRGISEIGAGHDIVNFVQRSNVQKNLMRGIIGWKKKSRTRIRKGAGEGHAGGRQPPLGDYTTRQKEDTDKGGM